MSKKNRIESLIRECVSEILRRTINNEKIGFISITGVKLSSDGSYAWIYYSQIGTEEEKRKTKYALKSASKFIKGEFGKMVRIKTVPNMRFTYDDSLERGVHIIQKLNELSPEQNA